jgi:NifU-like protein involved in Fe-S cluster formation
MEYSPEVRRRLEQPERRGVRENAADAPVCGRADDRSLNVWVCMQVEVADGTVVAARYEAYGCPHFLAAADWIAASIEGRPVAALNEPVAREAAGALEVPTEKLGKLLVVEDALAACARAAMRSGMKETN